MEISFLEWPWCNCLRWNEPVNEVILFQVSAATGNVSGHLQQVSHGEGSSLALDTGQHK